jgi:RNA polymerase sigma factor (sigma-70 family)
MESGESWKNRAPTVGRAATVPAQGPPRKLGLRSKPRDIVLATVQDNAASLLRIARRHSICADDALDAYQRALEIFIRRADTLEPAGVVGWLRTVVKHEAMAVRESRQRSVNGDDLDLDLQEARDLPTEDERLVRFDEMQQAAEALERLKPQELRALLLRAEGHSYAEICGLTGWSYTKVNRCITEGRKRFLDHCAEIETGRECARWAPVLSAMSDGEATAKQLVDVRPHLRHCLACRATLRRFAGLPSSLGAVVPVAALPAWDHVGHSSAGAVLRVYEVLAGGVHDRALVSAQKLQASFEVATTGKVAAVAASAAAITGGGVAAVRDVVDRPHPPAHVQAGGGHRQNGTRTDLAVTVAPPVAPQPQPAPAQTPATQAQPRESGADASARQEFGIEHGGSAPVAAAPSSTSARAPTASPSTPGGRAGSVSSSAGGPGEFGP